MNQQDHDRRSLAWHHYVVERMRTDADLLIKAKTTLDRWQQMGRLPNRLYLAAWDEALREGLDAVAALATDASEQGNALRQCSPISCIMPNDERLKFREEWKRNHL